MKLSIEDIRQIIKEELSEQENQLERERREHKEKNRLLNIAMNKVRDPAKLLKMIIEANSVEWFESTVRNLGLLKRDK